MGSAVRPQRQAHITKESGNNDPLYTVFLCDELDEKWSESMLNRHMKVLTRSLALVLLLLCALTACSDPPIGSTYVTDLDKFNEYNGYVKELLENSFNGSFPSEVSDEWSDAEYCYDYQCAALGEAVFSRYLSCKADDALFQSEQTRIAELTSKSVTTNDGGIGYLVNCDEDELDEYFNDTVLDGYTYCFEIVFFDESSGQIEYLTAYYVEGITKPAHLDDLLTEVRDYFDSEI